jgi:type IV pilus assembly protein PilW
MHSSYKKSSRGYTLIELMVAIALGLGLLAGLLTVMASGTTNSRTNERVAETQINGRYALNSIRQELLHAGNRAYTAGEITVGTTTLGTITSECLETGAAATKFVSNIGQAVWGSNNSNPFSGSSNCIPDANYVNGEDVLVIRRIADVAVITTTALVSGTFYFASNYAEGEVFRGTTIPSFAPSPLAPQNYAVRTYVYYISPFTRSSTESPKIPALYRVYLKDDGNMDTQLVASGIEHLQVQYGRYDTVAKTTQYSDTLTGTSIATIPTQWDDVNSVRIQLLARDTSPEAGYSNTATYTLGDNSYTVADNYRRQVFSTVVQLRNKHFE